MVGWVRFVFPIFLSGFVALAATGQADTVVEVDNSTSPDTIENVLLTVELGGDQDATKRYTLAQLRALGEVSFETETIWTTGPQQFTGVSLAVMLAQFGSAEGVLQARAINDYMVEIPVTDAIEGGPIIAYQRNGKTMPLRSKGPLWIVYPYDSNPAYKTEAIYSRSIWQLDSISIAAASE